MARPKLKEGECIEKEGVNNDFYFISDHKNGLGPKMKKGICVKKMV